LPVDDAWDAEQQMEAKLVVVGGKAKAEQFALTLPAIVGRSRSADVPLNHPLVSRQHCELFESDGQLMVRDLGSLNGTFVGDARVTDEVLIEPGGHLTIGSVTFEAVYDAPPSVDGDDAPDFEVEDEEEADLDQTIDLSNGKRAPAEKPAPAPAAEADGFDMGWLDEGSEDGGSEDGSSQDGDGEQGSAETEESGATQQADLTAPLDLGDEDDDTEEVVEKRPPARPEVSRGKMPPPKKPAAAAAPHHADDLAEIAPAEAKKAEGAEGGEDLDDFFRSLSEP
jgi:pSer/pThr/pTyr-binding forkhead associated (FHA) protein